MTYEELVKNKSAELIERLITYILGEDYIEIHYDYNNTDEWAIVSMHVYENDQQISIRVHPNDQYDLYFGYYNDEDEFFEIVQPLSEEDKKILPEGLKKIMKSVVDKEEGMRVPGNFLSKTK